MTGQRTKLRDEVIQVRKEAQPAQALTDSEKKQRRSTVFIERFSLSVTIEAREKMTDTIKSDLNRPEAQMIKFVQQIRGHQDTINSLNACRNGNVSWPRSKTRS